MGILKDMDYASPVLLNDNLLFNDKEQRIYLSKSKAVDDRDQYFLKLQMPQILSDMVCQGYIYFYLNFLTMTSRFIGIYIKPEFRNEGLASLLVSTWIQFCLDNGFETLMTNKKQRKPFLIHLLKRYYFDINNPETYKTSPRIIHICQKNEDLTKYLLFDQELYRQKFEKSKIYTSDNYHILDSYDENIPIIDDVLVSTLHSLQDAEKAYTKSLTTINKHN